MSCAKPSILCPYKCLLSLSVPSLSSCHLFHVFYPLRTLSPNSFHPQSPRSIPKAQGAWDTPFDSANTRSALSAPSAEDRRNHGAGRGGRQDSLCRATSGPRSVPWGGVDSGLSGGHRGQDDEDTAHRGAVADTGKVWILCQGQWGAMADEGTEGPGLGKEHSTCLGENGQEGSWGN